VSRGRPPKPATSSSTSPVDMRHAWGAAGSHHRSESGSRSPAGPGTSRPSPSPVRGFHGVGGGLVEGGGGATGGSVVPGDRSGPRLGTALGPHLGGAVEGGDTDRAGTGSRGVVEPEAGVEGPGAGPGPGSLPPGPALAQDDASLVDLLRQRPKFVPMLRSREAFRRYFAGLPRARMLALLTSAYDGLEAGEREDKVAKRMELLEGLLC
jgi:hypothetical protein